MSESQKLLSIPEESNEFSDGRLTESSLAMGIVAALATVVNGLASVRFEHELDLVVSSGMAALAILIAVYAEGWEGKAWSRSAFNRLASMGHLAGGILTWTALGLTFGPDYQECMDGEGQCLPLLLTRISIGCYLMALITSIVNFILGRTSQGI